jgi:hypothetical protein
MYTKKMEGIRAQKHWHNQKVQQKKGFRTFFKFVLPMSRLILRMSKYVLPMSRSILRMSRYILPMSKYILPMSKCILPMSKYILRMSKYVLPMSRFILRMSKGILPIRNKKNNTGMTLLSFVKVLNFDKASS